MQGPLAQRALQAQVQGGSFCQGKQSGGLGQKIPGDPSRGCSQGLVWTPVWLVVACPGFRVKWWTWGQPEIKSFCWMCLGYLSPGGELGIWNLWG